MLHFAGIMVKLMDTFHGTEASMRRVKSSYITIMTTLPCAMVKQCTQMVGHLTILRTGPKIL